MFVKAIASSVYGRMFLQQCLCWNSNYLTRTLLPCFKPGSSSHFPGNWNAVWIRWFPFFIYIYIYFWQTHRFISADIPGAFLSCCLGASTSVIFKISGYISKLLSPHKRQHTYTPTHKICDIWQYFKKKKSNQHISS